MENWMVEFTKKNDKDVAAMPAWLRESVFASIDARREEAQKRYGPPHRESPVAKTESTKAPKG